MTTSARAPGARRARRGPLQVAAGVVAFVAVVGSVVVAFTDDARYLKLALVTVLWVAVGALFFVEQMRRRADTAVARSADLRVVYELELEREVRARREQELATEREVRERVSAQVRQEGRVELDELREELKALRENLSLLLSGDLLVERVALRAESTRLRSLTDTARLESGSAAQRASTPGGPDPLEAETVEHASEPVVVPTEQEPQTAELEVVDSEPAHEPVVPEPTPERSPEPVAVPARPAVRRHGEDAPTEVIAAVRVPEPADAPAVEGAAPGEGPDQGAHSAGRSVSDLLAAYGASSGEPRRRRRSED